MQFVQFIDDLRF